MLQKLNIHEPILDLPVLIARAEAAAREGASVRVADLARTAGVSVRTVYRASARQLGGPPMARFRLSRLREVRRRLLAPAPEETVTTAAMECGFFHLGRFSALYRRQFGESPSETLRRSREMRPAASTRSGHPKGNPRSSSRSEPRAA